MTVARLILPAAPPPRGRRQRAFAISLAVHGAIVLAILLSIRGQAGMSPAQPTFQFVFEDPQDEPAPPGSNTPNPPAPEPPGAGAPDTAPEPTPAPPPPPAPTIEPDTLIGPRSPTPESLPVPDAPPLPEAPIPAPPPPVASAPPEPSPITPEPAPAEPAPLPEVRLALPPNPAPPEPLVPELKLEPPPPLPPVPRVPPPRPRPTPPRTAPPSGLGSLSNPMDLNFGPAPSRLAAPRQGAPRGSVASRSLDLTPGTARASISRSDAFFDARAAALGADWMAGVHQYWLTHRYYPRQALETGTDGTVAIDLTVNRYGRVIGVQVKDRSGSPFLDMAAVGTFRNAQLPPLPPEIGEQQTVTLTISYILLR